MSNRTAIIIGASIVVLALLILTNFGRNLPFTDRDGKNGTPTGDSRPERPDAELLARFPTQSIDEMIAALLPEQATPEATPARFSDKLPNAPLPFSGDESPRVPEDLKAIIAKTQEGSIDDLTLLDRWKVYLSMIALDQEPSATARGLKIMEFPPVETENFSVQLVEKENPLQAPVAIADFEPGGALEIASHGGSKLFKSNSDGTLAPLSSFDEVSPGNGIFPADFDGDGDQDVFITRGGTLPNSLLQNIGNGQFEDVTIEKGLLAFSDTATAAWLDYDSDGWIDLLVGNRDHPLELYRQTSAGLFEPVAWELKLRIESGVTGVEVSDINLDGLPDFYLAIDGSADQLCITTPSTGWDGWRFPDISEGNGIIGSMTPSAAKFFDFDNDGDQDLLIGEAAPSGAEAQANLLAQTGDKISALRLYQNNGDGTLSEITDDTGLGTVEEQVSVDEGHSIVKELRNPAIVDVRCIGIVDLDSDGYEDFVIGTGDLGVNRAFWNRQGMDFRDVSVSTGMSYIDSPLGFVSADLNGDGATELLSQMESGEIRWQETIGGSSNWLNLDLAGSRPGTRVAFVVRDQDWVLHPIQRVSGTSPRLTVGLGNAKTIESIQVFAPEKTEPVKMLESVEPNQSIEIQVPKTPKPRAVVPLSESSDALQPAPATPEE